MQLDNEDEEVSPFYDDEGDDSLFDKQDDDEDLETLANNGMTIIDDAGESISA